MGRASTPWMAALRTRASTVFPRHPPGQKKRARAGPCGSPMPLLKRGSARILPPSLRGCQEVARMGTGASGAKERCLVDVDVQNVASRDIVRRVEAVPAHQIAEGDTVPQCDPLEGVSRADPITDYAGGGWSRSAAGRRGRVRA